MPNVKVFVDDTLLAERGEVLAEALGAVRTLLCEALDVPASACHLIVIAVRGMPDQPQASVEMLILPKPERTRAVVSETCGKVQAIVAQVLGVHTAVRAEALDPITYIALK